MVTVSYICTLFERFGMINFHQYGSKWRHNVQKVYTYGLFWLFVVRGSCQCYNVVTRATRYLPELIQVLLEMTILAFIIYIAYFFQKGHEQLTFLSHFMDNVFSKADRSIIQKCHRYSNMACLAFFAAVSLAVVGSFLETFIPLSKSELDIRRKVYRTKYPERRLPYNMRIPFVDESESWAYETIYVIDMIVMFYFIWWVSLSVSLVPVMIIHVKGQYEILCKYICIVGKPHADSYGNNIFYSNIVRNECYIKLYTAPRGKKKLISRTERLLRRKKYEQNYLRQIIEFHKHLVTFQKKVSDELFFFQVIFKHFNFILFKQLYLYKI
ncbi:hypothetical protein WDU94_001084 [Cyamophila willieti]